MLGGAGRTAIGAGSRLDNDVITHVARLTKASAKLQTALNYLVTGLKADGIWDKIHAICVQHENEADSLYDLKGNQDSTDLTGATWSTSGWLLGNDTGAVNSQVNPSTSSYMNTDDTHIMTYFTDGLTAGNMAGGGTSTALQISMIYNYGAVTAGNISSVSGDWVSGNNPEIAVSSPKGFMLGSQLSGVGAMRLNGIEVTEATTGVNPGSNDIYIGNFNGAFTGYLNPSATCTGWSLGSGLTATQRKDYYNRIQTYMETMGWQA